jgi:hypothetical protein
MKLTALCERMSVDSKSDSILISRSNILCRVLSSVPDKFFLFRDLYSILRKRISDIRISQSSRTIEFMIENRKLYHKRVGSINIYRANPFKDKISVEELIDSKLIGRVPASFLAEIFLNEHNDSVFSATDFIDSSRKWYEKYNVCDFKLNAAVFRRFPHIVLGKVGSKVAYYGSSRALKKFERMCNKLGRNYTKREVIA